MPVVKGAESWRVERQSGRAHDPWRVIQESEERSARRVYARIAEDLSVGGLRLVDGDGRIVRRTSRGSRHR